MDLQQYEKILTETAYIRTSGSPGELQCAKYLMARMEELGLEPRPEAFPVARTIPDNMKKKLDEYLHRVRPEA